MPVQRKSSFALFIQEDRCCTYKGLTLTGSHLGNLTLMENNTTEELYIVVNHFPLHIITTFRGRAV